MHPLAGREVGDPVKLGGAVERIELLAYEIALRIEDDDKTAVGVDLLARKIGIFYAEAELLEHRGEIGVLVV